MILDVGCGGDWQGEVNADIKKPCQVMCDAYHLPFRAIDKAILSHVLEHLDRPDKALDEAFKVAKIVEIIVPHAFHPYSHIDRSHKWFFTSEWFREYAKKRGRSISGVIRLDTKRSFYYFGLEICLIIGEKV